jgi:type IV secretory pathway VirB10-like protein
MAKVTGVTGVTVTSVSYTRRFNIGNYEHEEFSVAAVDESNNPVETIARLKGAVSAAKEAEEIPWGETKEAPVSKRTKTASVSNGKKRAAKAAEEAEEETVEDVEEDLEEDPQEEELEEAAEEETSDEEDEEVESPKGSKNSKKAPAKSASKKVSSEEDEEDAEADEEEAPKKKSFKKKGSSYSRNSDLHKKLFVEAMNETLPGFLKKNAGRAKTVSIKMEGKDFLDAEGQILPTFKKEMVKLAKSP